MAVIALLGSGEFMPWARPVDGWCAEQARASSDRALVVPTACAQEGPATWDRWASMGTEHYRAIGLTPQVLPLRERADASDRAIVDAVADARIIFFSGGNPGYLAETLDGTPFWEAVLAAVGDGTAIGGCSAGASFLGARAPYVANEALDHWTDGLKFLEHAFVVPHFDMLDSYGPGLQKLFLSGCPDGARAVGIDENTALCGDGAAWTVLGEGAAWFARDGSLDDLEEHRAGQTVDAPLGLTI